MSLLGIRAFSREVSRHIDSVVETGEPVVLTKRGRPVAAIVALDDDALEDFVLAHAPEFALGMRAADEELRRGETSTLAEILEETDDDEPVTARPGSRSPAPNGAARH
jgi:prevent-host-death family protein